MTPRRARALLAESGYAAPERKVVGPDGRLRHLTATMTIAEYDEISELWRAKASGSFNDVLRDLANAGGGAGWMVEWERENDR